LLCIEFKFGSKNQNGKKALKDRIMVSIKGFVISLTFFHTTWL